jgi:uncharacterized membrane protein YesL
MKSTNDFFRTVTTTIRYSIGELITINILWVVFTVLIVTMPPAFAGLYYATNQLAQDKPVTRRTFFEGFKKYFLVSYGWFLSNGVVLGLLLFNISLSTQVSETWVQTLTGVYWILILIWLCFQIYTFPFVIQQKEPKLFLAIRNSAILWLKHGGFSFTLSIIIGILVILSIYLYPSWLFISASFIAYLANLGLVYLLSKEKITR